MTEDNQSATPQAEAASMPKPGDLLRVQRETAGLSYVMVAEALHLTVHYIKALEGDEYSKLPGLTFVKGYFRAYARFLRMDEEAVIKCYECYLQELGEQVSEQEHSYRLRRRNDQVVIWAVIAGVILLVGLAAGWWFYGRQNSTASVSSPRAEPAAVQTAVVAPPPVVAAEEPEVAAEAADVADGVAADVTDGVATEAETNDVVTAASGEAETLTAETAASLLASENIPESDSATDAQEAVTTSLNEEAVITAASETADSAVAHAASAQALAEPATALETTLPADSTPPVAEEARNDSADVEEAGKTPAADHGYLENNVVTASGERTVQLLGEGDDRLQLNFRGSSWVEVDDAAEVRLYNDLMNQGDALSIQSTAPFYILLGDATQVEVILNANAIDFSNRIRQDKSARFIVSEDGASRWIIR